MGAFYRIDYAGTSGSGAGALALANGKVAGLDLGGGIYRGTYVEEAGHRRGIAVLSMPNGGLLVNGLQVPSGTEIPIEFAIPIDAPGGHTVTVSVAGRQVGVVLHKVGDL
ncbi:hypothetical protein [Methylobacterium gregans]|uniref:hypothetical protein n=1 Tax=Methylobacterium gregans TaxID=374424 RepID=UPI002794A2FA|nr:hypothetical protein [Methylobacterium gregans]MDQ0524208.1 hypothetical protein [Methylobacterium gregans]